MRSKKKIEPIAAKRAEKLADKHMPAQTKSVA
jgi:hypothetical protein